MLEERSARVREARIRLVVARTGSGERGIACRLVVEEVGSAQVPAPEISVRIAVDCVGARFGDDIQDYVSGLSVFRVVVVGENLKFLDFFDRRTQSVARGDDLVGYVASVEVDRE